MVSCFVDKDTWCSFVFSGKGIHRDKEMEKFIFIVRFRSTYSIWRCEKTGAKSFNYPVFIDEHLYLLLSTKVFCKILEAIKPVIR